MSTSSRRKNFHRAGPSTSGASKPKPKPKKKEPKVEIGKDYIFDLIKTMEDIISMMKDKIQPDFLKRRTTGRGNGKKVSVLDVYSTYLDRYKSVLEITSFEIHAELFLEAYEQNRSGFLKIMDDDAFLLNDKKDVQIWYGRDNEKTKARNCRLPLSLFYRYTAEMRDDVTKKLTGSAQEDAELQATSEYTIGSELLYCFLLVVREAAGSKHRDYKSWTPILKELAVEAHIGNKNNNYRGITEFVDVVMNAAGRAGYTDNNGVPLNESGQTSRSGVLSLVDKLMDGDTIEEMIGSAGKGALNRNSPDDINETLKNIASTVLPKVADVLTDAVKPPPGVHVTAESQRNAESMAKNIRKGMDKLAETMNDELPGADPGEPESDTDPGSNSDSDASGSGSETEECSDSDSSDSEESD